MGHVISKEIESSFPKILKIYFCQGNFLLDSLGIRFQKFYIIDKNLIPECWMIFSENI